MRELKFRAWDKLNKKMLKPVSLNVAFHMACIVGGSDEAVDYLDAIFMQYTGLKDMKGREIYEGDIVKHEADMDNCHTVLWEQEEWVEDGFHTGFMLWGTSDQYIIVGNKYENPEMEKMVKEA